jgi:hypothetical protein
MEKLMSEAQNLINMADGTLLSQHDNEENEYDRLAELLGKLNAILLKVHTIFNKAYFRHTASPQQLYISSVL